MSDEGIDEKCKSIALGKSYFLEHYLLLLPRDKIASSLSAAQALASVKTYT